MWLVIGILIWFRWYMGAGKDACSYGFGYGVFSFVCEVMRYMGELAFVLLLMVIGVCTGLLPIIVCLCIYEFNDTFPDPDSDGDDEHLKKE
jgi:prolipoprotein diacylglyceryltransferase